MWLDVPEGDAFRTAHALQRTELVKHEGLDFFVGMVN